MIHGMQHATPLNGSCYRRFTNIMPTVKALTLYIFFAAHVIFDTMLKLRHKKSCRASRTLYILHTSCLTFFFVCVCVCVCVCMFAAFVFSFLAQT